MFRGTMKRRNLPISWTCLIVVSLALAPFPGRWGVLKDLLPILAVGLFYWRVRAGLKRAVLSR